MSTFSPETSGSQEAVPAEVSTQQSKLSQEELDAKYLVETPKRADHINGGVVELNLESGTGNRRVEIDGESFVVLTNEENGKIVELLPYSVNESGETVYGKATRSETLLAKIDPARAEELQRKLSVFTEENYNSLDKEGQDALIDNFFKGTDTEIQSRINDVSGNYDVHGTFGFYGKIYSKIGYNKGQFQSGVGWNK